MKIRQRHLACYCIALCFLSELTVVKLAKAQDIRSSSSGSFMLNATSNNRKLEHIAFARYALLKKVQNLLGGASLLVSSEDCHCTVLFPFGRSDRVYVLSLPNYVNGEYIYSISCYRQFSGKPKCLYFAKLARVDRVVSEVKSPYDQEKDVSLLNYITMGTVVNINGLNHVLSYSVNGWLNNTGLMDLAAKRDYVEYDYYFGPNELEVNLISNIMTSAGSGDEYLLDEPSPNNMGHENGTFFDKHGLPPFRNEIGALSHHVR